MTEEEKCEHILKGLAEYASIASIKKTLDKL